MAALRISYPPGENTKSYNSLPEKPDTCPVCHRAIDAARIHETGWSARGKSYLLYRCPRGECGMIFIAQYTDQGERLTLDTVRYPYIQKAPDVSKEICALSPKFLEIYQQAHSAKAHGLEELYGMGLRKALEFLIKDYCIKNHPELKQEIEKDSLAHCIQKYISDGNVKICAQRATWLGNDETHYLKKFSLEATHIDQLIKLTMFWIDSQIMTAAYLKEMPDLPKKAAAS